MWGLFRFESMVTILILFGAILLGFGLRNVKLPSVPSWMMTLIIWVLLLVMGIPIGSNPEIIENFGSYGKTAIILGGLATLGSAGAAILILFPICSAGVASIDVVLPVIVRTCGSRAVLYAIVQGVVLEIAVPSLVFLFCH